MLDFSIVNLDGLTLHKIGNKSKGEENFLAQEVYNPSEEQKLELLTYFLMPFKSLTQVYKLRHSSDISYNEVYSYCTKIFKRTDTLINRSADIVKHLYEQSDHPNIKTGEVFIAYFTGVIFEGQEINAIGIFKSERKESFFQFKEQKDKIVVNTQKGVHSKKLDKGCLILDIEKEDGMRIFTVDNNNYDAEYWTQKFLNIEDAKDYNYQTRNYVALCKEFSSEIIGPDKGKQESLSFLNQSIKYLSENESFELGDFNETIFDSPELKNKFKSYKNKFEKDNDVKFDNDFEISKPALKHEKKKIKNQITLDNQIQIKLGFTDNDVNNRFIEKGYDERKKMFYYKIYFNRETD